MMVLSAAEFRNNTAKTLNRVAFGKERIILGRRGEPVAVLISLEDYGLFERLLEEHEDRLDVEAANEALKEAADKGERPIPWEEVKKDLGL